MAALNRELGDAPATLDLFESIRRQNPELAQQCYFSAEEVLMGDGQYELCLKYLGGAQKRFDGLRDLWQRNEADDQKSDGWISRSAETNSALQLPMRTRNHDQFFVAQTRRLLEILVGTGHQAEAENIQTQALAVLNVPDLQSAVSDAKKKIRYKMVQESSKGN